MKALLFSFIGWLREGPLMLLLNHTSNASLDSFRSV